MPQIDVAASPIEGPSRLEARTVKGRSSSPEDSFQGLFFFDIVAVRFARRPLAMTRSRSEERKTYVCRDNIPKYVYNFLNMYRPTPFSAPDAPERMPNFRG